MTFTGIGIGVGVGVGVGVGSTTFCAWRIGSGGTASIDVSWTAQALMTAVANVVNAANVDNDLARVGRSRLIVQTAALTEQHAAALTVGKTAAKTEEKRERVTFAYLVMCGWAECRQQAVVGLGERLRKIPSLAGA